jgi:hypothetical protein
MKKLWFGLLALVATAVLSGTATAAPPGQGLETLAVTCNGQAVNVTVSAGSSFWIGDQHYVVTSFITTFTPEDGDPQTFTETSGKKKGLAGSEITCTATFEEPGEGTFAIVVTAVAVPPRG